MRGYEPCNRVRLSAGIFATKEAQAPERGFAGTRLLGNGGAGKKEEEEGQGEKTGGGAAAGAGGGGSDAAAAGKGTAEAPVVV